MIVAFTNTTNAMVVAGAVSGACAVLSVVVVLRRWAFIGEGISHAGFGGIATAWVLSLAVPALAGPGAVYLIAVLFCVAAALAMGYMARSRRFGADSAIGIFMVASLAWGFLALSIYQHAHHGGGALSWEAYLFGNIGDVPNQTALAAVALSAAVLLVLAALAKEVLAYSYDPELARVGGVPATFVHYLLMLLLALVVVIGMRIVGNVLMTALLILPGATALLLSRRLGIVIALSIGTALIGGVGGVWAAGRFWPFLSASGPSIVLVLFAEFLAAWAAAHLRRPAP